MIKKLFEKIHSSDVDIKERLIHRIIIIGLLLCFIAFAEIFAFTSTYWTVIPVGLIFVSFFVAAIF